MRTSRSLLIGPSMYPKLMSAIIGPFMLDAILQLLTLLDRGCSPTMLRVISGSGQVKCPEHARTCWKGILCLQSRPL